MSKKPWLITGLLICLLALSGCSQPIADYISDMDTKWGDQSPVPATTAPQTDTPEQPAAALTPDTVDREEEGGLLGIWDGGLYINHELKFTAALPKGWHPTPDDTLETLTGYARETIEDAVSVSTESAVMLMMCTQHEYDLTLPDNPSINITYSNQQYLSQLFSDPSYLDQMIQQVGPLYQDMYNNMFMEEVNVNVTGKPNVLINNKNYIMMSVITEYSGGTMYQDQYITDIGAGFLTITLSCFDQAMRDVMRPFIDSIVFE